MAAIQDQGREEVREINKNQTVIFINPPLILSSMVKKKEEIKEADAAKQAEQIGEIAMPAVKSAKCISCNTSVVNDVGSVKFLCPNCGQYTIIRCSNCRKTVAKYKCPVCGFEGPN